MRTPKVYRKDLRGQNYGFWDPEGLVPVTEEMARHYDIHKDSRNCWCVPDIETTVSPMRSSAGEPPMVQKWADGDYRVSQLPLPNPRSPEAAE